MTTHTPFTDDTSLDDDLRALDVGSRELDDGQRGRKEALLAELVRDRSGDAGTAAGPRPGRWARAGRWVLTAAAVAGITGALVLSGGPDPSAAYASWTPTPRPVTGAARTTAEQACREDLQESLSRLSDVPPDARPTARPETARTVAAEQRGEFVFLAMVADDSSTTQCFFEASDLSRVQGSTGGLATASSPPHARLRPGQIEAGGAGMSSGPEGSYAFSIGRVAPGTTAVTVHSGDRTMSATVSEGHFAAWWPVPADTRDPDVTYDVTTADGRVVTDAPDLLGDPRPLPGPREIGRISTGGGADDDGGFVATIGGRAGAEVSAVTIHVDGTSVSAQVKEGAFHAEWPSAQPEVRGEPRFDLHLSDGSVLRSQEPIGADD